MLPSPIIFLIFSYPPFLTENVLSFPVNRKNLYYHIFLINMTTEIFHNS